MKTSTPDFFADIATAHPTEQRLPLEIPPSAVIPDVTLPLSAATSTRRLDAPKISTSEEVKSALAALREKFQPFMADLAPALPKTRDQLEFKTFAWRIEQPADQSRFDEALRGDGAWETVKIPHYGPPLGKAATLYRCEFERPEWTHDVLRLRFGGVDYRCQVYLNGFCVGTHEGFFEEFSLDCTHAMRAGTNVLLIRVENDYTMLGENIGALKPDGDKIYAATGLGYDEPEKGWHHCPAAMGIWNTVRLEGVSRLWVDDLWVRPLPETHEIEIRAEVESRSANLDETVALDVSIFGQNFEAVVHLNHIHRGAADFVRGFGDLVHGFDNVIPETMGSGRNDIVFRLPMPDARIWNPATPWLYQLQMRLLDNHGVLLDAQKSQFGMRTFTQDEESTPKGKFYLNGKETRLRGANTMGNFERCIMKGDLDGMRDQILLAKLTNLNYLRMTQRPVHREFYDYCDQLGMMVQTDMPLFSTIRRSQFAEVVRQAGCMERHVRRHCSNILVSFINEPRPAAGSKPQRFLYRDEMEELFDMSARYVRFQNPGRVVKYVDGDYDPPATAGLPDNHVYCGWYIGHGVDLGALHQGHWLPIKPDWHYGCGEFGAEGLDSYEVMAAEYPEAWKPASPDAPWTPEVIAMSQTWKFHYLWYDAAQSARGWIDASQDFQAWVIGMMTQSYRRMPGMNSFAIHLFIDAWPAGWMKTILDVYCTPKKAWYAYRDSLTPLAVFLRSDRTQVWSGESFPVEAWICNDHPEALTGLTLSYDVRLEGQVIASGQCPAVAPACAPECLGHLNVQVPEVATRSRLVVGITLLDAAGTPVHNHDLTFAAFPARQSQGGKVWAPSQPASPLLQSLGLCTTDSVSDASVVFINNPAALELHRAEIQKAVSEGATAVLLNLPPGEYRFGSRALQVREAGMGPRHFVSRNTGHPMVEGFEPNDFRFWFHQSLNRVAPLLHTVVEADGWSPILLSGDGGWTKEWDYMPAAAEVRDGKGLWRICQVTLPDCVESNPAAWIFASRLLKKG